MARKMFGLMEGVVMWDWVARVTQGQPAATMKGEEEPGHLVRRRPSAAIAVF